MKTRDKILKTMYELIAKHGYDKTSIAMICDEIGIKKPSVYYYFKSKEEIFLELIDALDDYYVDYDIKENFHKESFEQDLIQMGFELIDSFENDRELAAVVTEFYNQSNRIESVKKRMDAYESYMNGRIKNILMYGVKIGALPKTFDIDFNTELLVFILENIEISYTFGFKYRDKEIWETTVRRMFLEIKSKDS